MGRRRSTTLTSWAPWALSLLRLVAALLLVEHGAQKLLGFPPGAQAGAVFGTMPWWAGVIELAAGVLLALGLFTRAAALAAAGEMAAVYWIAHAGRGPYPVNNGGDAAILFGLVFLYLVFAGPGPFSLDARRRRA